MITTLLRLTSTSLTQDFSSRDENIFTATLLPRHSPLRTSPNLPLPIHSFNTTCLATVLCSNNGSPDPDPEHVIVIRSWEIISKLFLSCWGKYLTGDLQCGGGDGVAWLGLHLGVLGETGQSGEEAAGAIAHPGQVDNVNTAARGQDHHHAGQHRDHHVDSLLVLHSSNDVTGTGVIIDIIKAETDVHVAEVLMLAALLNISVPEQFKIIWLSKLFMTVSTWQHHCSHKRRVSQEGRVCSDQCTGILTSPHQHPSWSRVCRCHQSHTAHHHSCWDHCRNISDKTQLSTSHTSPADASWCWQLLDLCSCWSFYISVF